MLLAATRAAGGAPPCAVVHISNQAAEASSRDAQWRQDLQTFAVEIVRRHPDPFRCLPRARFEAEIARLQEVVPRLKEHEILIRLMRITAQLGDAHTGVGWERFRRFYPLGMSWFRDGLLVAAAPADRRELLGARLVRIGDTPIESALVAVAELIPHENEPWLRQQSPTYLVTPEILDALGILPDSGASRFVFRTAAGKEVTAELAPVTRGAPLNLARAVDPNGPAAPLYRRKADLEYWYEYLADSKTLYVKYNRCSQRKDLPFKRFCEQVWTAVEANGADRFVIDLRQNAGGDSALFRPMLDELKRRDFGRRSRLVAIIGPGTFSSGYLNALELKRHAGATLVGSATGQRPNHFGEVRSFVLSNSGVRVQHSTKFFRTMEDDPPSLEPDITIEALGSDYLAGRDPVLERILELKDALPRR
jgi:hypothetical protein